MNIISTTNLSSGLYTYATVNLVEQFGIYAIIICRANSDLIGEGDIFVAQKTTNYNFAVGFYKDYGGVMENETLD